MVFQVESILKSVRKSDFDKSWQLWPELLIPAHWALTASSAGANDAENETEGHMARR